MLTVYLTLQRTFEFFGHTSSGKSLLTRFLPLFSRRELGRATKRVSVIVAFDASLREWPNPEMAGEPETFSATHWVNTRTPARRRAQLAPAVCRIPNSSFYSTASP